MEHKESEPNVNGLLSLQKAVKECEANGLVTMLHTEGFLEMITKSDGKEVLQVLHLSDGTWRASVQGVKDNQMKSIEEVLLEMGEVEKWLLEKAAFYGNK